MQTIKLYDAKGEEREYSVLHVYVRETTGNQYMFLYREGGEKCRAVRFENDGRLFPITQEEWEFLSEVLQDFTGSEDTHGRVELCDGSGCQDFIKGD